MNSKINNRPKKIAFISTMSGSEWGGSEELWSDIALKALKEGCEILVITKKWDNINNKIKALEANGAKVILEEHYFNLGYSKINKISKKIKGLFFNTKDKIPFLEVITWEADYVLISNGWSFETINLKTLIFELNKNKISFNIINHFHPETGSISIANAQTLKQIFNLANDVFFVSQRNLEVCERQIFQKINNASVVFNPVNIISKEILPFKTIDNVVNLASVARLDCNYKGQDILLEALKIMNISSNWVLNIYGTGPDKYYLEELTKYLELEGKIIFHNQVKNIREVWENNHLLILPSIAEGTPLSLIEAMYCGRPSIVSDVGGNAEYIIDGKTGYIIDRMTSESIAKTLEKAFRDINNWEMVGKNAHEFVKEKIPNDPINYFIKKSNLY